MNNSNIVERAEQYVKNLFLEKSPAENIYHDLNHTIKVVEASKIIGKESNLSESEMEIALVSAWFHDVGYFDKIEKHEEASVEYAEQFLNQENVDSNFKDKVCSCIISTKMPQEPKTIIEQVVCDADLHHLGEEDFF